MPPRRRAHAHRQARYGLRRRYQPTPAPTAAYSWTPDPVTWQAIKRHSVAGRRYCRHYRFSCRPGGLAWKGLHSHFQGRGGCAHLLSRRALMPSELEKGVIKPWPRGHSAGRLEGSQRGRSPQPGGDAKPAGVRQLPFVLRRRQDHGNGPRWPSGQPGMYILAPVAPQMAVRKQDVIQWSSPEGRLKGSVRIGFMSQVSPDGQYVVTTVNRPGCRPPTRSLQQLLRGQFQGLPLPPGVLSDPRILSCTAATRSAAAARRRR